MVRWHESAYEIMYRTALIFVNAESWTLKKCASTRHNVTFLLVLSSEPYKFNGMELHDGIFIIFITSIKLVDTVVYKKIMHKYMTQWLDLSLLRSAIMWVMQI